MDDVLRQVVGVFAEEVKEQAQRIANAVLAMDADAAAVKANIEELYRQAHSLKGSSSSLGVEELEALAHNLEEAWLPVRRGSGTVTPALVDASLKATDAARLRADGLVADDGVGMNEVQEATAELIRLVAGGATAPTLVPPPPEEPPPPPVEEPASGAAPAYADAGGETLRVATEHLAALSRRVDEMRPMRGRLDHHAAELAAMAQAVDRLWHEARARSRGGEAAAEAEPLFQLRRAMSGLRRDLLDAAEQTHASVVAMEESLAAMRMVPATLLKEPLARAVREACRRVEKDARFELEAGDAQLDRRLLEELKSALLHLVRNAVDHGIEPAEVREAIGKPARATITVAIEQRGREVHILVRDDGRGVDLGRVRNKAIERGLVSEAEAAGLADHEVRELLFRPGFSTADEVTELSGRGVGLDVVREAIVRLRGTVELRSEPGRGVEFALSVPLTIATSELMLAEECGRSFALPLSGIDRIVRVPAGELRATGGRVVYHLDDRPIPVVRLARIVGLTERHEGLLFQTLIVLRSGGERAALLCERLLGSQDLVLRPLPLELQSLKLLANAAILPNGQPVFVLSVRELVEAASESRAAQASREHAAATPGTILVADDSITTRALLRTVLESSGFEVRIATDGEEALRLALSEPFSLVVSDVRMPRLDGFGLTTRLRSHPRTAKLPVVLFSSLDSEEDQRRGVASGADAYLTKSAFDRGLLVDVIGNLLRGA